MTGAVRLRRADVLWRVTSDRVLIRVPGADETIELTGSGVALWLSLESPVTRAGLVEHLSREHGVDTATIDSDIEPVVNDLVRRGVLLER